MYSEESEQALLGGLLIDPGQMAEVSQMIKPDHFFIPAHQKIFGAMVEMAVADMGLDPLTVAEYAGMEAGQAEYLYQIASNTFNHGNALAYAKVVSRYHLRRETQRAARQIQEAAMDGSIKEEELVSLVQGIALKMDSEGGVSRPQPKTVAEAAPDYLTLIEERMDSNGKILGTSTGLTDLDELIHGMNPGELIVVAGRPAMGKTTLAMNFCSAAANMLLNDAIEKARKNGIEPLAEKSPKLDFDGHVQVFSLEMPINQLMDRLVSSNSGVTMTHIIRGTTPENEMDALLSTITRIRLQPLVMDDSPKLTPSSLRLRARAMAAKMGTKPKLIMVDYLQLMESGNQGQGGGNRTQEISDISRGLKLLAREMQCPVVALSQLNRGLEQRVNKRPLMSDLRESGSIEQDSDVIIFTYRDEVYNEDTEFKDIAELIVAKQRQGSPGTVRVAFDGPRVRFRNLAASHYDQGESRIY
ncbi:replicative DNA helicase [Marinospirillum sp.]|uniref:replicative DNA helicase n=1 Tax=Marinospirillum sp. TaxID=2183934 RepID=UPI0025C71FD0|nr:replicative DNA helicase [Marinospirillum sp.]